MSMGNIHLVTGYAGQQHVTAEDQAAFNVAMLGGGQFVLPKGNQFATSIITNNQVRVLDGEIYMQGRYIRLNEGKNVDLTIESGAQNHMRNDLIVARYTKSGSTGVEDANLVVIKGTAVTSNPVDPAYTVGDLIENHDSQNDLPLYRVVLNGIAVEELVPLFTVINPSVFDKQDKTDALATETAIADGDSIPFYDVSAGSHKRTLWSNIKTVLGKIFAEKDHKHKAGDITSGVLAVEHGGTGFDSLSALAGALGNHRIVVGSYVGTGTYGSANPCVLTFDFEPKAIIIDPAVGYSNAICSAQVWCRGKTMGNVCKLLNDNGYHTDKTVNIAWDGNTVSWYNTENAQYHLGVAGRTYYYIAVG